MNHQFSASKILHITLRGVVASLFLVASMAQSQQETEDCTGVSSVLVIDKTRIEFIQSEKAQCVNPDGTFTVRIVGANNFTVEEEDFFVREKGNVGKIRVERYNPNRGTLQIRVSDLPTGVDQHYLIGNLSVGIIDPRVRVRDITISATASQSVEDKLKVLEAEIDYFLSVGLAQLRDINDEMQSPGNSGCSIDEALKLFEEPTDANMCGPSK